MRFSVYIPARHGSTRLTAKLLAILDNRPVIHHVCERALASGADKVVVATDDDRIADAVSTLGVEVCMTRPDHPSGTDRIAEAAAQQHEDDAAVIVNLQADEVFMPTAVIHQVAAALDHDSKADVVTVCECFGDAAEVFDPNIVKVVRDASQRALYFSRAPIPWDRTRFDAGALTEELSAYRRHAGIYAYRVAYLKHFVDLPPAPMEQLEKLEQLRVLYHGGVITVPEAVEAVGIGIDTAEDLERAQRQFAKPQ